MRIEDWVGNVAVVVTIMQFLSGILVCRKFIKNQTTGDSSPLPFLTSVASGFLWLLYGIAKNNTKLITVNVIGMSLNSLYSMVFYAYTPKKESMLEQYFMLTFLIGCVTLWNYKYSDDLNLIISGLGIFASIVTLIAIASPMIKLPHVIKTKSTNVLPLPLIFMSCVVSFIWFIYAVLVKDLLLAVVNLLGVLISFAQLLLFIIFPSRRPKRKGIFVS